MRLGAAIVLVVIAAAIGGASSATAASDSTWYWTPGACKSELLQYGVQINDGRTFNVAKAFCVGLHNHCWLNDGHRRYKVFDTVMRSYDGAVRTMQLTVTGKSTWSGHHMKLVASHMPLEQFDKLYGPAAWAVANAENQGGCHDIHP